MPSYRKIKRPQEYIGMSTLLSTQSLSPQHAFENVECIVKLVHFQYNSLKEKVHLGSQPLPPQSWLDQLEDHA